MKFKFGFWLFSLCAALFASAADEYVGGPIGTIPVAGTGKRTIVAVAFKEMGATASDVSVSNILSTVNLAAGDAVFVYKNEAFQAWTLTEGSGVSGTYLYWEKTKANYTVGASGVSEQPGISADAMQLGLGEGFWLVRNNSDTSKPFYLIGQYVEPTLAKTAAPGAKTLLGNPTMKEQTISTTGSVEGDTISLIKGDGKLSVNYKYGTDYQGKTGWMKQQMIDGYIVKVVVDIPLQIGQGFWYNSTGSGEVSFTWK